MALLELLRTERQCRVIENEGDIEPVNGSEPTSVRSRQRTSAVSFARHADISVLIVLGFGVVLCWPTWSAVSATWSDPGSRYTHGWPSVVLALWLLLRELRERGAIVKQRPGLTCSMLLLIVSVAWAVAETAALQGAAQLLALVLPMLLVVSVFNRPAATAVCGISSLPLCALPSWDVADLPMQQLTIAGVTGALWLIRLPVNRDGSLFMTPYGSFDVQVGCNGLQMLLAAWTIAAALAVRQRVNALQYVRMMATAALIAIVANWLRITIVIVVGYVSKMRHYLVSNEHYVLGWLLFGLGMALFAWFVAHRDYASAQSSRLVPSPSVGPQGGKWPLPIIPLSASLAGIGPVLFLLSVPPEAPTSRVSPSPLPDDLAVRNSDIDWATEPAGAVRWWAVDIRDVGSTAVWATLQSLEFERVTQAMDKLLSKRAIIDWQGVQIRSDLAARDDGFSLAAGVDRNGQQWALAWRLSVAGRAQPSPLRARLRFAAMTLLGVHAPIRLERLAVPCTSACLKAEAEVARLLGVLGSPTAASNRGAG